MLRICQRALPKYQKNFNLWLLNRSRGYCFSTQQDKENKETGSQGKNRASENQKNINQQERDYNQGSYFDTFKKISLLVCAGVIGGFLGYNIFGQEEEKSQQLTSKGAEKPVEKIKLGGEWKLLNTQSQVFTSKDLSGSYYLIYFGYAKCPDICPTTLNYIANVYRHIKNMKENEEVNLKVVFVSVDPQRDKPEAIRQYLNLFDSSFIGLTGTDENDENFQEMRKKFKVYSNKIPIEGGSYNIDHTSLVFLMSPDSEFVGMLNPSLPQKQSAQLLIKTIKAQQALKSSEWPN